MIGIIAFLAAAGSAPLDPALAEAKHALASGRLVQARTMVASAVRAGAHGEEVERVLADLDFASGKNVEALARYNGLLKLRPDDAHFLERAAIAALKLGDVAQATLLTERAIALPSATWRAWNAHGVAADFVGAAETAESAYSQALALAPEEPEILNNLGWSRLLRRDWAGAIGPLELASKLAPNSVRTKNNLELARAALSGVSERAPNETSRAWAARLNDAGVVAHLQGDRQRAVAAFSRAIRARNSWYARAADNLRLAQAGQ